MSANCSRLSDVGPFTFIQLRATRMGYGSDWFPLPGTPNPRTHLAILHKAMRCHTIRVEPPFLPLPFYLILEKQKDSRTGTKGGKQNIAPAERKSGRSNAQSRGDPRPPFLLPTRNALPLPPLLPSLSRLFSPIPCALPRGIVTI